MKKLIISIIVLALASISIIALFYPDYSENQNDNYFMGTVVLELVHDDGSKVDNYKKDALAKEAMNNTIESVNYQNVSILLRNIGYDDTINLQEVFDRMKISSQDQYLTITTTSFDGVYVDKILTELGNSLTKGLSAAPYYQLVISRETTIKRNATLGAFFDRRLGEEITVGIFVLIWIGVLGWLLMCEIKRNENKNGAK